MPWAFARRVGPVLMPVDVKVGLPRWSLTTEISGEWRQLKSWRESICLRAEEPEVRAMQTREEFLAGVPRRGLCFAIDAGWISGVGNFVGERLVPSKRSRC